MGNVFRAVHLDLGREAAVKILHPGYSADPSSIKRFQQEAQILSSLHHRNILRIFGFGAFDGCVYLALEFVHGKSLGHRIREQGRLKTSVAIPMLLQICNAMEYAHSKGVLHRDLKPDNVLVTEDFETNLEGLKVADFGLAKLLTKNVLRLTRTNEVVGDPRYMSPEQCRGQKLDERSDVYSFGCLMYELLTGVLPFDANDPVAIMHKHLEQMPAPFAIELKLPPALETITLTAMSKKADDRYQSFAEVATLLKQVEREPSLNLPPPPLRRGSKRKLSRQMLSRTVIASLCTLTLVAIGFSQKDNLVALYYKSLQLFLLDKRERVHATLALASTLERQRQLSSADAEYQSASAMAKDDAYLSIEVKQRFAEFLLRTGNQSGAANLYADLLGDLERQISQEKTTQTYDDIVSDACGNLLQLNPALGYQSVFRLTALYRSRGDLPAAEKLLLLAIANGPRDQRATALFHLGTLQLATRNEKLANALFNRALDLAQSKDCRLFLAHSSAAALHENGMHVSALKYYLATAAEASEKSYPRYARLIFQTGDCYALLNKPDSALQQYRKAIAVWQGSSNQLDRDLLPTARERLAKLESLDAKKTP